MPKKLFLYDKYDYFQHALALLLLTLLIIIIFFQEYVVFVAFSRLFFHAIIFYLNTWS